VRTGGLLPIDSEEVPSMSGGFISRGFRGRRRTQDTRLPPGQYLVEGFPALSAGPTPRTPLEEWDFSILGEIDKPRRWTWEGFRALPSEEITTDIHCVTKWSKLGTTWEGVSLDTLLDSVDTAAEYVVAYCDGGYTTNLTLKDGPAERLLHAPFLISVQAPRTPFLGHFEAG
jgi:DMSO/TMAO reductase YedYZ molybdopterin-dependent catalytic subunit